MISLMKKFIFSLYGALTVFVFAYTLFLLEKNHFDFSNFTSELVSKNRESSEPESDKIHLQKDRPKNAYKVALLQFSNPKYAKTYFKLIEDVKCYADRHGYAHILETRPITKSTNYGKIGLAVKEMEKNYDVIVGLDVDVIIGNHSKRVEEFLTPNQDIYLNQRFTNIEIMSGMFIIKVSNFSRRFMQKWLGYDGNEATNLDNGALHLVLAEIILDSNSSVVTKFKEAFASQKVIDWNNYVNVIIQIRRTLLKPDPKLVTKDAVKFKIFTGFQGFGRCLVDPIKAKLHPPACLQGELRAFWRQVLGNEIFIHSKQSWHFMLPEKLCTNDYWGPAYNASYKLSGRDLIRNMIGKASEGCNRRGNKEFTHHIARCWPNCPDQWNGDDWLWKLKE